MRGSTFRTSRLAAWLFALGALSGFVVSDFHVLLENAGAHEVGVELASERLQADCSHAPSEHVESAVSVERPECAVVVSLSQLRSLDERPVRLDLDRPRRILALPPGAEPVSSPLDRASSPRGPPLG